MMLVVDSREVPVWLIRRCLSTISDEALLVKLLYMDGEADQRVVRAAQEEAHRRGLAGMLKRMTEASGNG